MMVGVPDPPFLALAEQKVKEMDISLAIHNHGPDNNSYPSPESAYTLIEKMDKRMGLCIDVGHTQRLGLDPAKEVEKVLRPAVRRPHEGRQRPPMRRGPTVECGRASSTSRSCCGRSRSSGTRSTLHFEHEKDAKDPFPGLAESVGYVRGVMATI